MNKKSFFLGVLTGAVLTFVGLVVIGLANKSEEDPIQYFEKPVSYEGKTETSFKVLQVFGKSALATEESTRIDDYPIGRLTPLNLQKIYSKKNFS